MNLSAIAQMVDSEVTTATATVQQALDRIERAAPLQAVTRIHRDRAMQRASARDRARKEGGPSGGLERVPFAVKNIFDVDGCVTRAGSRATDGNPPASRDAFAIRKLEAAGAVLVADTNMDEFAYGFTGENVHDGATKNPRNPALTAGGSSSGSAALVAAGVVPLALGTDTNGSIRVPAALSGVAGLKPTYGRLSRSGVFPFVRSLDHVGLLAAKVSDLAVAYDVLLGHDSDDPVQSLRAAERIGNLDAGLPLRSARLGGYFASPLHPDVKDAVEWAAAVLEAHDTVQLERAEAARGASFVITTAEGGQQHLARLARDPDSYGPLVRDRLRAGALVPAAWTARAQKLRRLVCEELDGLFRTADILLAPATPCPAFPLGTDEWEVDGVVLPIRLGIGMFTQALTLTGVPIAVVSCLGKRSGLPVGVQVIGRAFEERSVLGAALKLERAGFHVPPEEGTYA
jgi:aspartyl-tRNA(Asn)/glutamyl-tRNA(Gln) amidotransferase subunit A